MFKKRKHLYSNLAFKRKKIFLFKDIQPFPCFFKVCIWKIWNPLSEDFYIVFISEAGFEDNLVFFFLIFSIPLPMNIQYTIYLLCWSVSSKILLIKPAEKHMRKVSWFLNLNEVRKIYMLKETIIIVSSITHRLIAYNFSLVKLNSFGDSKIISLHKRYSL